jgi:hypothetical protein
MRAAGRTAQGRPAFQRTEPLADGSRQQHLAKGTGSMLMQSKVSGHFSTQVCQFTTRVCITALETPQSSQFTAMLFSSAHSLRMPAARFL